MDINNPSTSLVIEELLSQNSQLRLELATLMAFKKQKDEIDMKLQQSSHIPPEAAELIAKLDIR